MYSRKENKMAKNQDSFDMDKWSKGRKEKAEKPIKEKKEKETSFDMDDSGSFSMDKHTKKDKKEKTKKEKLLNQDKETNFEFNEKKSKPFFAFKKDKDIDLDTSSHTKIEDGDEFNGFEGKKSFRSSALFKFLSKNKLAIIIVSAVLAVALIIGGVFLGLYTNYGQQISHISIESMPDNVVYYVGEEADFSGLKLVCVLNNGKTTDIDLADCVITGFDTSKPYEYQKITIRYLDYFIFFNIVVNDNIKPIPKLTSITMDTLPKTEYRLGDRLDTKGGVICCYYNDGTSFRVSLLNSYVSGFRAIEEPGVYELTVTYEENGIIATTTYTITVTE